MAIQQVEFLHWAKTHPRATYELTVSGIAPVRPEEFDSQPVTPALAIVGAYGHPELLSAIAARYRACESRILPAAGTSTANLIAVACAADGGHPVAIESPAYEPLIAAARFVGSPILRFTRDRNRRFAPRIDEIQECLDRGARAVIMSDLHNPSGCLCPASDLRRIADDCSRSSATLIVDEVYRDLAHLNAGHALETVANVAPNIVATNSLTKSYGFGGIRAGWLIGPADFIERARWALNHLCVDLPAPTTAVALNVFARIDAFADRARAIYRHNHRLFSTWLATRQDVDDYGNDGATFSYMRLPHGVDADAFSERLRQRYDTQVVSGAFFDDRDHVRIAYGSMDVDVAEGLSRVGRALDDFRR